ncbi:MAG: hypothetical protein RMM17_08940 [Acidobacteriota bacterium]|nr:hypothetical protein [Blastocatellia bacterium]MDW8412792.1 hypothetical protein [Acidobacteriota bacterium]
MQVLLSNNSKIAYEHYEAATSPAPAVVILHGAGGLSHGRKMFAQSAKMIARNKIAAFIHTTSRAQLCVISVVKIK